MGTAHEPGPDLGPLTPLIGRWEGDQGYDESYVYARRQDECVRYREQAAFVPAGPAHNGAQSCCRLDYRIRAWRVNETEPFHVEVGYWFWDADHDLVMRGLVTPRGIAVLAGGSARAGDTTVVVSADVGSETFGILSNPYLLETARTTRFETTLDLSTPDVFEYQQKTFMYQPRLDRTFCHSDRNRLVRTSTFDDGT